MVIGSDGGQTLHMYICENSSPVVVESRPQTDGPTRGLIMRSTGTINPLPGRARFVVIQSARVEFGVVWSIL